MTIVIVLYIVWLAGLVIAALGGSRLRSLAPQSTAVSVVALLIFLAGLCWPFVVLYWWHRARTPPHAVGHKRRCARAWLSKMPSRHRRGGGRIG